MKKRENRTYKLVLTALFAALSYAAFTYLKIPIPSPAGGMTPLHIGNAFCVLAALLLGGIYGGVAGSLGMTIADLLDPVYITSAPRTFILKLCIGLITGFVAHNIAKINKTRDKKYIFKWSLISSICALGFNVIADPIAGYLYKKYILGVPADVAKILSTWAAGVTFINAIAATLVVIAIYMAIRPIIEKLDLVN